MNRILFGGAALVGVALSGALTYSAFKPAPVPTAMASAAATAAPTSTETPAAVPSTSAGGEASEAAPAAPVLLPAVTGRSVHIGIVFVTFAGAQNAPEKARSRDAAQELARRLAEEATRDFHAAVSKGDPGSADDLGSIQKGVLESATESAVFALTAGQVSAPIETPRGFWIVKRID